MNLSIETLEFPMHIKTKLLKMINKKVSLEFVNGKNILFNNTNLGLKEPSKIVVSNSDYYFIVLVYEEDDNLYINDLSNPISITKLITKINKIM